MAKDWAAVAEAVNTRLVELGMTQTELVRKSRVAPMTVQTIRKGVDKDRSPHTLGAISTALGWPPRHLEDISAGTGASAGDRLATLEAEVASLRERVERIEGTT
ncbi:hypothetical protein EV191_101938 [Tamaricihabitans halophyticus]|uniref:HTH cro/C1-type domain-containing protein n=1 Tax=Tamaricihabitans halophyticus TaxID=1262583 RepID=A0A4R2R5G4_9PSEU|nr:hypothetical protein EV191_101938 [Tamaricihabitans halophyticus]